MEDPRAKSFAKTLSWRLVATSVTITLVYIFTGEMTLSLGLGFIEFCIILVAEH